jgi:hypothetical protein
MNGYWTAQKIEILSKSVEALTEVVERQGREIEALKAKPPQIVRYEKNYGRLL